MPEQNLSLSDAFDLAPEPVVCCMDTRILYRNPAFSHAFPEIGEAFPPDWEGLLLPGAGALHSPRQDWNVLCWQWGSALLLRLTPIVTKALVSDDRLGLLSARIREPLGSINAAAAELEQMLSPFQYAASEDCFARINRAKLRMIRLARYMELISLPEDLPPYDFDEINVDLGEVCQAAVVQLESVLASTEAVLTFSGHKAPLYANCDVQYVHILIYNLVANALAATHRKGHLELRLERRGNMAHISVLDDGPGMTPAQLRDAFQPAPDDPSTFPSLHLGLLVCSRIARLHHGALVLSNRRRGLRATFSLPLAASSSGTVLRSTPFPAAPASSWPVVLRELSGVLPYSCFNSDDM